jgi:hypothetical protein
LIHDCIRAAFATSTIARAEVLSGGLINTNIKVEFTSNESPVVLRFYRDDAAVCLKGTALLRLLRSTVPVPEVIYAEPDGINGIATLKSKYPGGFCKRALASEILQLIKSTLGS